MDETGGRMPANHRAEVWHRFLDNRPAVAGSLLILLFTALALLAPVLAPGGPRGMGAAPMGVPSRLHWMGTDNLGRDVYSQFVYGARVSLAVAALAVLISTVLGVLIGILAGHIGGLLDDLMMRVTEFFQVIPRFLLAVLLVAVFGATVWNVVLVIGGLSRPVTTRLVRGEVLALREFEFVEAARAQGSGHWHIMLREILPNALPAIVVNTSLEVGRAILLEAGLSFIGLGDASAVSWGSMLYSAQPYLRDGWWMMVFPGMGIFLVVWGVNLLGDGLNEALNPKA